MSIPEYISNFYRNVGETIEFVRIVKDETGFRKIRGTVAADSNLNAKQTIIGNDSLAEGDIAELETKLLAEGFRSKFDEEEGVLFLQIHPEDEASKKAYEGSMMIGIGTGGVMSAKGCGGWLAHDYGPGGANILYTVSNWDLCFGLMTSLMERDGALQHCLIARRLHDAADDWTYEVVHPADFKGVFNAM